MPGTHENGERQRLTEIYRSRSDAELKSLADDAASLTDLAREVLRSEIFRRGLDIPLVEVPAPPPVTPILPIIRLYRDVPDALIAQSVLDSAGIDCFLFDENIIRLNWFLSYAVGQIKLRVADEDAPGRSPCSMRLALQVLTLKALANMSNLSAPIANRQTYLFAHS